MVLVETLRMGFPDPVGRSPWCRGLLLVLRRLNEAEHTHTQSHTYIIMRHDVRGTVNNPISKLLLFVGNTAHRQFETRSLALGESEWPLQSDYSAETAETAVGM